MTFDEKIAYRKFIEDSMDSNDEEEHEDPKEESTCYLEHSNEDPEQPLESMELVIVLETRKKQKYIKLPVAPLGKEIGRKYSLVMRHL